MLKVSTEKEKKIINFIKKTVKKTDFSKAIVACSGGIDSALCLHLCVKSLGKENVLALKLPYGKQETKLADLAIKSVNLSKKNIFEINIKRGVDAIIKNLKVDDLRKGNISARVRMIYLYDLAKEKKALVCGTENRSEYFLGYFTRHGDEASDFNPINKLYKTQVWELSKHLEIPQEIIDTKPSAGLWKGQTDEKELGFSYKESDEIVYLYCDKNLKKNEIVKKGFNKNLVEKVIKRIESNKFKREVPYNI